MACLHFCLICHYSVVIVCQLCELLHKWSRLHHVGHRWANYGPRGSLYVDQKRSCTALSVCMVQTFSSKDHLLININWTRCFTTGRRSHHFLFDFDSGVRNFSTPTPCPKSGFDSRIYVRRDCSNYMCSNKVALMTGHTWDRTTGKNCTPA